jgi:hypothetical protein
MPLWEGSAGKTLRIVSEGVALIGGGGEATLVAGSYGAEVAQEAEGRYQISFTEVGSIYLSLTTLGASGTPTFALIERTGPAMYMVWFSTGAFNPQTDATATPYGFVFQGLLPLNNEP